jgi:hypothetical protein
VPAPAAVVPVATVRNGRYTGRTKPKTVPPPTTGV